MGVMDLETAIYGGPGWIRTSDQEAIEHHPAGTQNGAFFEFVQYPLLANIICQQISHNNSGILTGCISPV